MDERLQEMLDHYEITKVLKAYCHGCDRCDEDLMRSVYVEDSWDDHGAVKATGANFSRLMTSAMLSDTSSVSHLLGQSQIKVVGAEAGAETYFIAVCRHRPQGTEMLSQLGGRYIDRLTREDGNWRIKHRIVVRDWSISHPIMHDWDTTLAMTPGRRSNDDLSYAALGMVHSGGDERPQ